MEQLQKLQHLSLVSKLTTGAPPPLPLPAPEGARLAFPLAWPTCSAQLGSAIQPPAAVRCCRAPLLLQLLLQLLGAAATASCAGCRQRSERRPGTGLALASLMAHLESHCKATRPSPAMHTPSCVVSLGVLQSWRTTWALPTRRWPSLLWS